MSLASTEPNYSLVGPFPTIKDLNTLSGKFDLFGQIRYSAWNPRDPCVIIVYSHARGYIIYGLLQNLQSAAFANI